MNNSNPFMTSLFSESNLFEGFYHGQEPITRASISHVSLSQPLHVSFLFLENNGGFWFSRIFRVKGELERFAKELLSEAQKQRFQLLLSGFCRKFSTLAQESLKSNMPTHRKAAFSAAWMKFLSNFQPGKSTHERMIAVWIAKNLNEEFSVGAVHGVLSVIHKRVYSVIHDHVRLRKAEIETTGTREEGSHLKEGSCDILYRYCGASLHRMIKLREETIAGKKGRGELFDKGKLLIQKELEILRELLIKHPS